jgi:uncharacterized damage-inducible protein DinB
MIRRVHPVLGLYARNAWANREVLRACASLDLSVLQRECPGTFGAVAPTLGHIIRGEQDYLQRYTGEGPSEWVPRDRPLGLDRLADLAEEGDERLRAILATGPDPEQLIWGEWEGRREAVAAWVILVQHVQHGDDHRAQIGTALGTAGVEPVNLSARAFDSTGPTPPDGVAAGAWADRLGPRFLAHSGWATEALLEHCLGLGDEVLTATAGGTYGTLHETLTHLMDADADYLSWLTGGEDVPLEGAAELDVLRRYAERSREGWRAYLASAPDHEREVVSGDRASPAWLLVVQAVHHANEHRSQVCSILSAHGLPHPALDGWAFGQAEGAFVDAGTIGEDPGSDVECGESP